MERDFLGLNWKDNSSSNMEMEEEMDIRRHSVLGGLQWPKASKVADGFQASICFPAFTGFASDHNHANTSSFPEKKKTTALLSDYSDKLRSSNSGHFSAPNSSVIFYCSSPDPDSFIEQPRLFEGGLSSAANTSVINLNISPNPGNIKPEHLRNTAKFLELSSPAPLTIFYSGGVHVYQEISPDQAALIMNMAGSERALNMAEAKHFLIKPSAVIAKDSLITTLGNINIHPAAQPQQNASAASIAGALPMARRATLVRFLDKRKNRCLGDSNVAFDGSRFYAS